MGQFVDLAAISVNKSFINRCDILSHDFDFAFAHYKSADSFFEHAEVAANVRCFILDCTPFTNIHEAAGTTQVARQMMERSYIVCILDSRVKPEDMELLKKSGADLIMLDAEFTTNSKLEFVTSQVIKSAHIPVKSVDLIPDTHLDCPLYMLMPKNQRFLKVYKAGTRLTLDFIRKFKELGELYLHRNDIEKWIEYIKTFSIQDENTNARICRSRFLKLQQSFLNLVLTVSDQTTSTSFSAGKVLFEECESFAKDLLESLEKVTAPWDIINNSSIGDFGSVERGTAIAAYAGLLSKKSGIGRPEKVMLGALLADIGCLLISPQATKKIRLNIISEMNGEEKMEYEKHPIYSLNQCLSRRIPLDESLKDMILLSHERSDQKGFPNRPGAVKIKEESMIVRIAQEVDSALTLRMGQDRIDFGKTFEDFIENKIAQIDGYSLTLLLKLRPTFKVA
jgi:hypothetical protein